MKSKDLPDYSEILESIQDGFVVVTRDLTYVYVNKKAEEIIGIPAKKLIGRKLSDAFPDHNLNIVQLLKVVKRAWIEKKVATLEIYFKPLNSWYSLYVYPFKDKFSVIFKDISEEKKLKVQLENSKEKLDIIFKNISDGIVIQEKSGKIIYATDSAANMGGFANVKQMMSSPEVMQERYDIFDEHKNPILWKDAPGRQVLAGKRDSADAILYFIDKKTHDGIWLHVRSAKISSDTERDACAISIFHNITSIKNLEEQKDNFLSLVSHELKTPLTILKVYIQVLQKEYNTLHDKNETGVIKKIHSNIDKLVELVHSLLDVSRIQEGKLQLKKRNFSLSALLQEVCNDIQPITHHSIVLAGEPHTMIYADRDRISQVTINFITNAIKYSKSSKQIIVSNIKKKNMVTVSVKDFGTGISLKDQQEIFKRFYQSSTHNTFPGLGLGLYISSEIIKAHGGSIGVKSKRGSGSLFYFTLPIGRRSK